MVDRQLTSKQQKGEQWDLARKIGTLATISVVFMLVRLTGVASKRKTLDVSARWKNVIYPGLRLFSWKRMDPGCWKTGARLSSVTVWDRTRTTHYEDSAVVDAVVVLDLSGFVLLGNASGLHLFKLGIR